VDRFSLEKKFTKELSKFLAQQRKEINEKLSSPFHGLSEDFWEKQIQKMRVVIEPFAEKAYGMGADYTYRNLLYDEKTEAGYIDNILSAAIEWVKAYSLEYVTKITTTTQMAVQKAIENFYSVEGYTVKDVMKAIMESGVYSPKRAETIAVTEITRAHSAGAEAMAKQFAEMGIEFDEIWETRHDGLVCNVCGDRHGKPRGTAWQGYPPAHPNCRCRVFRRRKEEKKTYKENALADFLIGLGSLGSMVNELPQSLREEFKSAVELITKQFAKATKHFNERSDVLTEQVNEVKETQSQLASKDELTSIQKKQSQETRKISTEIKIIGNQLPKIKREAEAKAYEIVEKKAASYASAVHDHPFKDHSLLDHTDDMGPKDVLIGKQIRPLTMADLPEYLQSEPVRGGGGGGHWPDIEKPSYVTLATTSVLANERVLTGTANQITVTDGGAGTTVTLSLPQNIHTGAIPQFAGLGIGKAGTSGNIVFSAAATISTTAGNLTFNSAGNVIVSGTNGIDYNPGSDGDVDIITVGVTGAPRIWWDESEDLISFTKGISIAQNFEANSNGAIRIAGSNDAFGTYLFSANNSSVLNTASTCYGLVFEVRNQGAGSARGIASTATSQRAGAVGSLMGVQSKVRTNNASLVVAEGYGIYIESPTITSGSITSLYGLRILDQSVGTYQSFAIYTGAGTISFGDSLAFRQASIISTTAGDLTLSPTANLNVTVDAAFGGSHAPSAVIHADQSSSTGAQPVLLLDQADIDIEFIKLVGSSEDGEADRSLVDVADMSTPGALVGWFQVYIQDDQATNPITDGVYYVPFYAAPSA